MWPFLALDKCLHFLLDLAQKIDKEKYKETKNKIQGSVSERHWSNKRDFRGAKGTRK